MLISTSTAAGILADALEENGQRPTISGAKVHALTRADLFVNYSESSHARLNMKTVMGVAEKTRYVADLSEIAPLILRVSVIECRENPVHSALDGDLLRTHAGISYSNRCNLTDAMWLGGFNGVWEVSEENADYLVENSGLLIATCKGYVHPDCVRRIVGWEPITGSSRKYFHTEPAPDDVAEKVGEGIWINVPPGRESNIDVDPRTATHSA